VDSAVHPRGDSGAPGERYARLEMTPEGRSRNDLLLDGAIALAVFAGSIGLLVAGEHDQGSGELSVAGVLFAALASLPVFWVRRAPLPVFVVTGLASIGLQLVADPDGPPLGATLALYWVAAAGTTSRSRLALTVGLVVAIFAGHLVTSGEFLDMGMLFGVALWTGAWLAGDRTRLRRERMAALEERAMRAEREAERERRLAAAEERGRIARDLHDSAGHAMNVILVHAGLGRIKSADDPESAREAFATIEEVARESVGEIDQMVRVLREHAALPLGGTEVEPPPGLAAFDGLVAQHRAAGLQVTTAVSGERRPLPPGVDRGAYRILQEALTNAARHGDGSAEVEIAYSRDALDVSVGNPLPRPLGDHSSGGGHGVIGMRERAALLGGSLEAGPRNGRFQLHAWLPFSGKPA
jgi:signal transduction histidine kinase